MLDRGRGFPREASMFDVSNQIIYSNYSQNFYDDVLKVIAKLGPLIVTLIAARSIETEGSL